jgi:hypothetical protein
MLSLMSSVYAKPPIVYKRYEVKDRCKELRECQEECRVAKLRSKELNLCLQSDDSKEGKCPYERSSEMQAYYAFIGCIIYFDPSYNLIG